MISVRLQPITETERAECPKCRNRDGIRDGGLSLNRFRAYDIMTDSFGLFRCPKCHFKGHRSQFFKPVPKQLNG